MPLSPGDKLGPYEILAPLGAGGMGEVYRARDGKLNRDVAIKVLPAALAGDAQYLARFEREAQMLAAQNHPNIATVYGIEQGALVMELVEGADLKGPLPLEEAIAVARKIAAGLEAAHEKGIIHRDLKPANIKLTPAGVVKILDFGLAKALIDPTSDVSWDPTNSPTTAATMGGTVAGTILGTAAYMAPEQARGKKVDKRADIWAFGVVLYEILTGKRLFEGDDLTETLASVVKDKPDLSGLPSNVRRLLERCLEKDPGKRLRDIGDLELLLEEEAPAQRPAPARSIRRWFWPAVAVALAIAFAIVTAFHPREPAPAEPVSMRFEIPAPEQAHFMSQMALSPDGRLLAFTAAGADERPSIWVRRLDSVEATPLHQSSTGQPFFWSPDSRFIAYNGGGKLTKVEVTGGPPQVICDAPQGVIGGIWTRDGNIIFGRSGGALMSVSAAGGVAQPLSSAPPGDAGSLLPVLLPDGRHFLYYAGSSATGGKILVSSLDSRSSARPAEPKQVMDAAFGVAFAPSPDGASGHLLFLRDSTLMAQPFDLGKLALTGAPVPLAQGVGSSLAHGFFSTSSNGVLAYRTGSAGDLRLVWLDRAGKEIGSVGQSGEYGALALSPDGAHVAAARVDGTNEDIWLFDQARNTSTRVTSDPLRHDAPVWSADGNRIAFNYGRGAMSALLFKPFNSDVKPEMLREPTQGMIPWAWSRDGRFLIYSAIDAKDGRAHLWTLGTEGERKATRLTQTDFFGERQAQFSPDGRWISYTSDESGREEIYVRPFPVKPGDGKIKVSEGGGTYSRWRRDGKELFYFNADKIMAVDVSTAVAFQAGVPKALFPVRVRGAGGGWYRWDVSPDGQRFLVSVVAAERMESPITIH
jgi:Tol biopolymer transport system component